MKYGLRAWDAAGNLTLDTSSRVFTWLGMVTLNTPNGGSIYVPEFANNNAIKLVFRMVDYDNNFLIVGTQLVEKIHLSPEGWDGEWCNGTQIAWEGITGEGYYKTSYLVYGVG